MAQEFVCLAGFRPGRRGSFDLAQDRPFVSAKGPKTMLAVTWPPAPAGASSAGLLRGSPTSAAGKLAELGLTVLEGLKQCPPILQSRLHCSATSQGQGSLKNKRISEI